MTIEPRSAVSERLFERSREVDTGKVESLREQPDVEEVLHSAVQRSELDHRLELLGDDRGRGVRSLVSDS